MNPLFSADGGRGSVPLFVYGQLLSGASLGWVMAGSTPSPAQVRGWLWRLPAGQVLLSVDPRGVWVQGEVHDQPDPARLGMIADLLGVPGLELVPRTVRARVGMRALPVQVPAAAAESLERAGAHRLRSGDWRRIAPRC